MAGSLAAPANEPDHRFEIAAVVAQILWIPFLQSALHIRRSGPSADPAKKGRGWRRLPGPGRPSSRPGPAEAMRSPGHPMNPSARWLVLRCVAVALEKRCARTDSKSQPDYSELRWKAGIGSIAGGATRRDAVDARPTLRLGIGPTACRYSFCFEPHTLVRPRVLTWAPHYPGSHSKRTYAILPRTCPGRADWRILLLLFVLKIRVSRTMFQALLHLLGVNPSERVKNSNYIVFWRETRISYPHSPGLKSRQCIAVHRPGREAGRSRMNYM